MIDINKKIEEYKSDIEQIVKLVVDFYQKVDRDVRELVNFNNKKELIEKLTKTLDDAIKLNPALEVMDGVVIKLILTSALKSVKDEDIRNLINKKIF